MLFQRVGRGKGQLKPGSEYLGRGSDQQQKGILQEYEIVKGKRNRFLSKGG